MSTTYTPGDEVVTADGLVTDADVAPAGTVDPRFRARRAEVRRAARRHRRRLFWGLVFVVLLIGATIGALYSPLLDVDQVVVSGTTHLADAAVIRSSGVRRGQQLVDVDLGTVRDRVARLPWVLRVEVERRWPDRIEIRVAERRGVATVTVAGTRQVVTLGGLVAGPAGALDAALPDVHLPDAMTHGSGAIRGGSRLPRRIADAIEMVGALPSSIATNSSGASVDESGEVSVSLLPSVRLLLGDATDVAEKFVAAETILGGAVVQKGMCRVDVRIPKAPTVMHTPACN